MRRTERSIDMTKVVDRDVSECFATVIVEMATMRGVIRSLDSDFPHYYKDVQKA